VEEVESHFLDFLVEEVESHFLDFLVEEVESLRLKPDSEMG
jgi:hypothetical protein